jgi:hypothetical protein
MINSWSGFGMHPEASEELDRFDGFSPPPFLESLQLEHGKKYGRDAYAVDIVPTSAAQTWSFRVISSHSSQPVTMQWPSLLSATKSQELVLQDKTLGVSINMREVGSYTFSAPSHFEILYGDKAYIDQSAQEENARIVQIYPNPSEFDFAISLYLPESASSLPVTLALYNPLGQPAATVYSGQLRSGWHVIRWSNAKALLPHGVYFLRLAHNGRSQTYRVVLSQ